MESWGLDAMIAILQTDTILTTARALTEAFRLKREQLSEATILRYCMMLADEC